MNRQSNLIFLRDLFLIALVVSLTGSMVFMFWEIFSPFIIAVVVAYLLNPIIAYMNVRFNLSRIHSVLIIYYIFFGLIALFLWFSVPLLIKEISSIQQNFPSYVTYMETGSQQLLKRLQDIFPAMPIKDFNVATLLGKNIHLISDRVMKNVPGLIKTIGNIAMNLILIPFITFFLLKDGSILKKKLYGLIPNQYYELYRNMMYRMSRQLNGYIRGQAMDAFFIAVLSVIGLTLIGIKYSIIIGLIAGISNLVPYFGPIMGMVPAIAVSIIDQGMNLDLIFLIIGLFFFIQLIDNILISPMIVGKSVQLHPIVVMLAIMLGGAVAGLFGMLLVIPFISVFKIVVLEIHREIRYREYIKQSKT